MKNGTVNTIQMTGKNAQRVAPLDAPKPRGLVIGYGGEIKIEWRGGRETGHVTTVTFINAIEGNGLRRVG